MSLSLRRAKTIIKGALARKASWSKANIDCADNSDGKTVYLDRQSVQCEHDELLNSFRLKRNSAGDKWGYEYNQCPVGYAAYGVDDPAGIQGPGKVIKATLVCCPLPKKDILTEQHVFVTEECPENHVATGSKVPVPGRETTKYLRCTKINTARYQLGTTLPSKYWGRGHAGWHGSQKVRRELIPAGLRHAMGRQAIDKWDIDGCVGYPWGSLFVKKSSKYCAGLYFKQLQYVGLDTDPAKGTPVKMFPDCRKLENIDDPENVRCLN